MQQVAFTSALLEALRMPGERNCATVERLDLYLRDRVPQLCQLHNKPEQVPMTLVEPRQKSYLILLPQFATEKDIAMLRSEAQEAEVDENFDLAEQLLIRVIAATGGRDLKAIQAYSRVQKKKEGRSNSDRPETEVVLWHAYGRSDPQGKQPAHTPGNAIYFSEDFGNGITNDSLNADEALFWLSQSLKAAHLTQFADLKCQVFRGCWNRDTYKKIALQHHRDDDYIREVGSELLQQLSQLLGERVTKQNLRTVVERFRREGLAERSNDADR